MQPATRSRLTLICILITILLDMIGVGIVMPVLPELIEELTGGSVAEAAVIGGYLVFVYAFMQFVFSPVLGNLSDRFGRRPVLLASLLGLTFDYLMMGFAPFVWYLFIGRIISGIAGAAVATATAYMADITPPAKRAQRFGLIGAAFGLGFIIGPVIGGELGEFGPRVPFYAAAALAFANFLFGLFVLPESLHQDQAAAVRPASAPIPFGAICSLRKYPVVLWLLGVAVPVRPGRAGLSRRSTTTSPSRSSTSPRRRSAARSAPSASALPSARRSSSGPRSSGSARRPVIIFGMVAAAIAFTGTAFIDGSSVAGSTSS